jgi:thiamine pyrophosphate-dependent acetolactate synthase large subunit-like protein
MSEPMNMQSNLPSQQDAISAALALYPARPFAVSDIGSQTGWLKAAGHDPRNLYVSGPMGLATSVALGLAAVRPNEQVLAIAGDGALAMNLTSLATIAGAKPKNLAILLVDNRIYEFTNSVPTPTRDLDWLAVGRAFFGEACLRLSDLTAERWAGVARPAMIVADVAPAGAKPPALGLTPAMIRAEFLGASRAK